MLLKCLANNPSFIPPPVVATIIIIRNDRRVRLTAAIVCHPRWFWTMAGAATRATRSAAILARGVNRRRTIRRPRSNYHRRSIITIISHSHRHNSSRSMASIPRHPHHRSRGMFDQCRPTTNTKAILLLRTWTWTDPSHSTAVRGRWAPHRRPVDRSGRMDRRWAAVAVEVCVVLGITRTMDSMWRRCRSSNRNISINKLSLLRTTIRRDRLRWATGASSCRPRRRFSGDWLRLRRNDTELWLRV